jgi:hypothetical protein
MSTDVEDKHLDAHRIVRVQHFLEPSDALEAAGLEE